MMEPIHFDVETNIRGQNSDAAQDVGELQDEVNYDLGDVNFLTDDQNLLRDVDFDNLFAANPNPPLLNSGEDVLSIPNHNFIPLSAPDQGRVKVNVNPLASNSISPNILSDSISSLPTPNTSVATTPLTTPPNEEECRKIKEGLQRWKENQRKMDDLGSQATAELERLQAECQGFQKSLASHKRANGCNCSLITWVIEDAAAQKVSKNKFPALPNIGKKSPSIQAIKEESRAQSISIEPNFTGRKRPTAEASTESRKKVQIGQGHSFQSGGAFDWSQFQTESSEIEGSNKLQHQNENFESGSPEIPWPQDAFSTPHIQDPTTGTSPTSRESPIALDQSLAQKRTPPQNASPMKRSVYFNLNDEGVRPPKRECKSAPMFTQRDIRGQIVKQYQRTGDFVSEIVGCHCQMPAKNPSSGKGPAKREKCAYAVGPAIYQPLWPMAPPNSNQTPASISMGVAMNGFLSPQPTQIVSHQVTMASFAPPPDSEPFLNQGTGNMQMVYFANIDDATQSPAHFQGFPSRELPQYPHAATHVRGQQVTSNFAQTIAARNTTQNAEGLVNNMLNRDAGFASPALMQAMERRNAGENAPAGRFMGLSTHLSHASRPTDEENSLEEK